MTREEVTEAYARFGALVHRRCQRILRDPAAAEDATQEVFLRLWRYGDAFQQAESKVAWLYRIAERCAFDILERRNRRGEVAREAAPESSVGPPPIEDWDFVQRLLARFDHRVRSIAVLHYLDGHTQEAIAATTGWSRQTVIKKIAFIRTQAEQLKDGEPRRSRTQGPHGGKSDD